MDTATKTAKNVGVDAEKPASKRVVRRTTQATWGMTGNEIVNKINSVGKSKNKVKKKKIKQTKRK